MLNLSSLLQVTIDLLSALPAHSLGFLAEAALTTVTSCVAGWEDAAVWISTWVKWVA
ncbi:hypothetical protein [Micromonospora sp. NBS 11-29]|uniref:hypothetical protein n=1 Tax=Micromonospora sp. NBS 11-29 TaxID=1960879 RepID=UPI00159365CC|nr:hypothetical protein [Micromonospora sp. NBS 11-29]